MQWRGWPSPRRGARPALRLLATALAGVALSAIVIAGATAGAAARGGRPAQVLAPLPPPSALVAFQTPGAGDGGQWHAAGRPVDGKPAVFETTLAPPGEPAVRAGIAWMDTHLLRATLYSGSASPGGLSWKYTAPIKAAQADTLVAAFNGGFKMAASEGGYFSEGKLADPLRAGAASFVIYKSGLSTVGVWGRDVTISPSVVAVRQNLTLLVDSGHPTALAGTANWLTWGATCAATSCSGAGIEDQWRSGVGVTNDGALVYVAGPSLSPLDLADLLARAGARRAMELDINPFWPTFATYAPQPPNGPASPANGTDLLAAMAGGPARFFTASWARDFVTMSAG